MRVRDAHTKPGHWPGFFVGVLLPIFLLMAGAAHAQVKATGDYLSRMDTDRDGRVSLAEYQDWMSYAFDAMDRDHDGQLSGAELPGGKGKPVSREDHRARIADTFSRQDRNHDGALDSRELAAPPQ
jgi:Ca2+-binding EF-hand superfamily protein